MTKEEFTKYEAARILGARALQISMNAPLLVKVDKETLEKLRYDSLGIAKLEFESGVLPISVKRPMPKRIETKLEAERRKIDKEEKIEEKVDVEKVEEKVEAEIKEGAEIMELSKDAEEETEEASNEEAVGSIE